MLNFATFNGISSQGDGTTNFGVGSGNFTIEYEIKSLPTDINQAFSILKDRETGSGVQISMNLRDPTNPTWVSQGSPMVQVLIEDSGGSSQVLTDEGNQIELFDGERHHVAVAVNRTTAELKIYMDKVLQNTVAIDPSIDTSLTGSLAAKLGYPQTGDLYYDGSIREIRIWSTERTLEEISANAFRSVDPSDTDLLHYWPCDEGSGLSLAGIAGSFNFSLSSTTWTSVSNPTISGNEYLGEGALPVRVYDELTGTLRGSDTSDGVTGAFSVEVDAIDTYYATVGSAVPEVKSGIVVS